MLAPLSLSLYPAYSLRSRHTKSLFEQGVETGGEEGYIVTCLRQRHTSHANEGTAAAAEAIAVVDGGKGEGEGEGEQEGYPSKKRKA